MLIRLCAILSLAGLAASASAQNALGDGRGLQKNTNRYDSSPGPVNRGYDAQAARLRNSIVYGNAAGGASLRSGTLRDPSQFMGSLGSDTLYSFRRDSFYSGLAGQGIRGTDALQYQFALTTGGTSSQGLRGAGFVSREQGASAGQFSGFSQQRGISRDQAALWSTDTARTGGALRSTSSFMTSSSLRPSIIGERADREGNRRTVAASPLLGVRSFSNDTTSPINASLSAGANRRSEEASIDPRSAAAGGPQRAAGGGVEPAPTSVTSYDSLTRRLQERSRPSPGAVAGPGEGTTGDPARGGTTPSGESLVSPDGVVSSSPQWLRDIEALRSRLRTPTEPTPSSRTPGTPAGLPEPPMGMRFDDKGNLVPLFDADAMRLVRESGGSDVRFIEPVADDRDPYVTEMKVGEMLFARGQFFLAEEKFAKALSIRPGDVSALTARLHAQIGGGLFASASQNLRELLNDHPEVAGVRYARDLLPNDERLTSILKDLEDRMAFNPRMLGSAGLRPTREAGLIFAYLSFQLGRPADVERGLSRLLSVIPDRDEPTLNDQSLAVFLRGVWLGVVQPAAPTPTPNPNPAPTPTPAPAPSGSAPNAEPGK